MTALEDRDVAVTKRCRKCNKVKPVSVFYKNGRSADGYGYYCRSCDKDKRATAYHAGNITSRKDPTRADRFIAGLVEPSELTHEELVGGFIYLDDGSKYESKQFDHRTKGKFTAELSKRLNTMIRDKSVRSLEVIFEIIDSDLVEPADRLKAATWWAERVIGKTPEKLELSLDNAPYETIFENLEGGSRNEHRKAIGAPTIDAEIVEDIVEDIEVVDDEHKNTLDVVPQSDDNVGINIGTNTEDESTDIGTVGISAGIPVQSTESVADEIINKRDEAKQLKKRVAAAKKRRYAARAVGASSLAAAPWLIDWRVSQEGLRACLVAPSALTPAKLDIIKANAAQTDDPAFIATQRAATTAAEAQRLKAKIDKLRQM